MSDDTPKKSRPSIYTVAFAVCLIVFIFSSYKVVSKLVSDKMARDAYARLRTSVKTEASAEPEESADPSAAQAAEAPSEEPEKSPKLSGGPSLPISSAADVSFTVDLSKIAKINEDAAGWITLEDSHIDYPIVRGKNNSFYLNHLFDGTYSTSGSIFMDYRCARDFSDPNTVIYGHRLKDGSMFADLRNYRKQEYYDSHPVMTITTPDKVYTVELISGTIEDGTYEFVRLDLAKDGMGKYVTSLKERSTFKSGVTAEDGDRIVSLCTCTYERDNARFMVVGKLTEQ